MLKISVVINTLNEEENLEYAINSIKWADEIIVCDMHSSDKTVEIAKKLGAKVYYYKKTDYVEPARNFAISKATSNWILILDADEEIPEMLGNELRKIASQPIRSDFLEIPRKNIIFGKWIRHSGWWPDYQVRFFKKGSVIWSNKIHSKPKTLGEGIQLPAEEKFAIIHHNYQSIRQFLEKMNRYSSVEAEQLIKEGYQFNWKDLLGKPLNEFLSRFFANKSYEDGVHGLALSFLQAFSNLAVYLKVWELSGHKEVAIEYVEITDEIKKAGETVNWWIKQSAKSKRLFKEFFNKLIH